MNSEEMDCDEFFKSIIEVDYGVSESDDDEEKENENHINVVKSCKAKKRQFNIIDEFMKQYKDKIINKEEFNSLWKDLIADVNSIGPPVYTEIEWKTKWSQHKYNLKRKRSGQSNQSGESSIQRGQSLIQNQPQLVHTTGDIFVQAGQSTIQDSQSSFQDQPQFVHTVGKIFVQDAQSSLQDAQSSFQDAQPFFQDQPQVVHTIALGEIFENTSAAYATNSDILNRLDQIIEKQNASLEKMDKTNSLLEVIARRAS